MKRKLVVNSRAKLDVVAHYIYLLGQNTDAAARFKLSVKAAQKRIRDNPRGCASLALEGLEDLELRFSRPSGFDNYLLIFQVTDVGPTLLRVLHSSQDMAQALRGAS